MNFINISKTNNIKTITESDSDEDIRNYQKQKKKLKEDENQLRIDREQLNKEKEIVNSISEIDIIKLNI